jgi:hypothetical protein
MDKAYIKIVIEAADQLVKEMLATGAVGSGAMPTVYAVPTTDEEDGRVVVVPYGGEAPARGVVIMPNANHASLHKSWYTTPYGDVSSILLQALRNQPILPREKPPTGPHVVTLREQGLSGGRREFGILLNGNKVGNLYHDKHYHGVLPKHDGGNVDVTRWRFRDIQTEIVRINRAAKEAGRV